MKKVFTKARYLLALVSLVLWGISPAQAKTETIFSAKVKSQSAAVEFSTGTTEINSDWATLTGGKMYAVSGQTNAVKLINSQSSTYYFCCTNNNTYFKVELEKALAVGDVISATFSTTGKGLYIALTDTYPSTDETKASTATFASGSQYTIKEGDELVGESTIYLLRNPASTTYFGDFKITREVEAEDGEYDEAAVTATFPFNTGAEGQTATFTGDGEDAFSSSSVVVYDMDYKEVANDQGITGTKMQPKSSASDGNQYTKFVITPRKGITFTPTKISFDAMRWGTDGNNKLHYYAESGSTKKELGNVNPNRNGKGLGWSHYEHEVSGIEATSDNPFALACYVYGLAIDKQISFANIVIEGTVSGKPEQETLYTVTTSVTPEGAGSVVQDPAGTLVAEGKKVTFSAVANAGYIFLNKWTIDGKEVEGATYTIESLSADVNVVAQFVKNPVITFAKLDDVYCVDRAFPANVVTIEKGGSYKLPNNYMYYKEGYTMTGWSVDGETKDCGDEITVTEDVTLTPIFTENKVSLATRKEAATIKYDFNQNNNGGRLVNIEGNEDKFITTATIDGETIDVVLDINCKDNAGVSGKRGKVNNESNKTTAQVNEGAMFTIPVEAGSVITISGTQNFTATTTFNGEEGDMDEKTVTYTAEDAGEVKVISGSESNMNYNYITVTYPKKATLVTVTDAGWATLYTGYALDFSDADLTVYTATCKDNTVTLTPVEDGIVPANTGVVLKGEADTYEIPVTVTSKEIQDNDLTGSATEDVTCGEEVDYYILAYKEAENKVQFTRFVGETIAAGKAYLELPKSADARVLNVVIAGETTGINEAIVNAAKATSTYNLNGQRVAQPTKGLYIVNGKKVIIK